MGVPYWRSFGEKISKGLSEKTRQRLGTGGRVLGRTGAVVGIGFLLYDFWKNYKENIEKEPVYGEMIILQGEMEIRAEVDACRNNGSTFPVRQTTATSCGRSSCSITGLLCFK